MSFEIQPILDALRTNGDSCRGDGLRVDTTAKGTGGLQETNSVEIQSSRTADIVSDKHEYKGKAVDKIQFGPRSPTCSARC